MRHYEILSEAVNIEIVRVAHNAVNHIEHGIICEVRIANVALPRVRVVRSVGLNVILRNLAVKRSVPMTSEVRAGHV